MNATRAPEAALLRPTLAGIVLAAATAIAAAPAAADGARDEAEFAVPAEEACDPLFDDECEEEEEALGASFPDPLEPTNRGVLGFNQLVDTVLLDPVTRFYGFIMPDPVKRGVRRFFLNVGEPATFANDVLQLEWQDAGVAATRFAINSTVGIGGVFDPASALGLEAHHSDFGQTLAISGVPSGPYMILPFVGPTTLRDGTGHVIDLASNPLIYILGPLSLPHLAFQGSSGLSIREESLAQLEALEDSSVDFYAALRSAYYQSRTAEIWGRREDRRR